MISARCSFMVWEGERGGSAYGRSYRTRAAAILAAWWASLYNRSDVWIEREVPVLVPPTSAPRGTAGDSGAGRS